MDTHFWNDAAADVAPGALGSPLSAHHNDHYERDPTPSPVPVVQGHEDQSGNPVQSGESNAMESELKPATPKAESPLRPDSLMSQDSSTSSFAPSISTLHKGKGREMENEELASESPLSPEIVAPQTPSDDLPGRLERFTLEPTSPQIDPETQQPYNPPEVPLPLQEEEPEEEWILKEISWPPLPPPPSAERNGADLDAGPTIRIITQNRNGPCSLIALCNILILRGDILITPPHRPSVSYSYLSSLFADYLLRSSPTAGGNADSDLVAALEILPTTRYGLNLNPRFGSIDGFRPPENSNSASATGELALFSLSKVPLLHGWVVDPQDEDTWEVVCGEAGDYDKAVEMVVEGQVISGGIEGVDGNEDEMMAAVEKRSRWTPEEERKVQQAHIISKFLSASRTQLTYHGLFLLSSHLPPSSLSALFRNSHLSVIYRRPLLPPGSPPGPELFTLVSDSSFTSSEQSIVWESLEDVEGGASEFFDGALKRIEFRGGDWVGRRPNARREGRGEEGEQVDGRRREEEEEQQSTHEVAERRSERRQGLPPIGDPFADHEYIQFVLFHPSRSKANLNPNSYALARQLQQEEDQIADREEAERLARQGPRRSVDRVVDERGGRTESRTAPPSQRLSTTVAAGSGNDGGRSAKKAKEKKAEKDKCIVM
ncbi:ubiquitin carboxyl-terminal hydrolase MINDY-1/2, partial [Phenoliferia sp. Uapishka_3]